MSFFRACNVTSWFFFSFSRISPKEVVEAASGSLPTSLDGHQSTGEIELSFFLVVYRFFNCGIGSQFENRRKIALIQVLRKRLKIGLMPGGDSINESSLTYYGGLFLYAAPALGKSQTGTDTLLLDRQDLTRWLTFSLSIDC